MAGWWTYLAVTALAGTAGAETWAEGWKPPLETGPATAIAESDMGWTTPKIIESAGYPCETHKVTTEDGYVLTTFRIPHGKGQKPGPRPVFWLQHGVVGNSDQYVQLGPEKALGFMLADYGYDVWLGNVRGNNYCQENIYFPTDSYRFWDFSWDQMGYYDLPANFDYVRNLTGEEKLYYVGHSMGCAMLLVLFDSRPEYQERVVLSFLMSPAVLLGHCRSPVFTYFCAYFAPWVQKKFGTMQLLSDNYTDLMNWFWPQCMPESVLSEVCYKLYVLTSGPTNDANPYSVAVYFSTNPSQTSVKTLTHFGQGIKTGGFSWFDYGKIGNMDHYGQSDPPAFNLTAIQAPIVLIYADEDYIAAPYDVYKLCQLLGNVVGYYRVPYHLFDHMDMLYGWNAKRLVYAEIVKTLELGPEAWARRAKCWNDTDIAEPVIPSANALGGD